MESLTHVPSYPSIQTFGHKYILDLLNGPVTVEVKKDGSFYAMGIISGEFCARSKNQQLNVNTPEKLFSKAIESTRNLDLHSGWIYYGEYHSKNKHNTLNYARIPEKHVVLFDVMTGVQQFLSYEDKVKEGKRLGLDVVSGIYEGVLDSTQLQKFLEQQDDWGGVSIEGVIIKNYNVFTQEKKIAVGKMVSPEFREKHKVDWKISNPTKTDIIKLFIEEYSTTARYNKAVQHLHERGEITGELKDISKIIFEVRADVKREEEENIKDRLFKFYWDEIERGITKGVPQYYKDKLFKDGIENAK